MLRKIGLAAIITIASSGSAFAENWYVISAARDSAVIMDAESRKTDQNAYVTTRSIHPGIQQYRGIPIVASQFRLEFDCKGSRVRTVEFAAIDVDGRVPSGLKSDKVRDWDSVKDDAPAHALKEFACEGRLPTKLIGPYRDFTDIEAKYLMWLDGKSGGDFAG